MEQPEQRSARSIALASVRPNPAPGLQLDTITGLPIRRQWDSNWGYCGETSLIAAGMSLGQYASQFTVRQLASPGLEQTEQESQLLLGVNDQNAATRMHLAASVYSPSSAPQGTQRKNRFIAWISDRLQAGSRVILGVYIRGEHDTEYDHILPALDVQTSSSGSNRNDQSSDRLVFTDNYGQVLNATFRKLLRTRRMANSTTAPPYSIPRGTRNYGLAISGVADPDQVTIPVRLEANRDNEPDLAEAAQQPPEPEPLKLQATVLIPDQEQSYNVYRYDDFSKVPELNFNAGGGQCHPIVGDPTPFRRRDPLRAGRVHRCECDLPRCAQHRPLSNGVAQGSPRWPASVLMGRGVRAQLIERPPAAPIAHPLACKT